MTEGNSNTMEDQIAGKLLRIHGAADILCHAATGNDELPGGTVQEIAMLISELSCEVLNVLYDLTDKERKAVNQ